MIPPEINQICFEKKDALDKIAKEKYKLSFYDLESLAEDGIEKFQEQYYEVETEFYSQFEEILFYNVDSKNHEIGQKKYRKIIKKE